MKKLIICFLTGLSVYSTQVLAVDHCLPPSHGDWVVESSCTLPGGSYIVNSGDLVVQNDALLTISPTSSLEIDVNNHKLLVRNQSGVLVRAGGKIDMVQEPSLAIPASSGADTDADGDGLLDTWQSQYSYSATDPMDVLDDSDGDGVSDLEEMAQGTDPHTHDTSSGDSLAALPDVSGDRAGYTAGSFSVNESGNATYTVDIAVPPGSGGMAPQLSLVYDSSGANRRLGPGWSLAGLSNITRCAATLAQDGFIDGVDFDDEDRFCLDGKRLVAVDGFYGDDGTEYYTENQNFSKIVSYGIAGNGPASFKVWTKSGLVYEYGNTDDARFEAQGQAHVLTWAVNKISDTVGNYLNVSYVEDAGEHYPEKIDYTGNDAMSLAPYNSVEFVYEDRTDHTSAYIGGSKVRTLNRLKEIQTYAEGSLVRGYRLGYDVINDQSVLTTITECAGSGECLSPSEFTWQSADQGFSAAGFDLPERFYHNNGSGWDFKTEAVLQDINGDGIVDFSRATCWHDGVCDLTVYHGTGSGYEDAGYDLPHPIYFNEAGGWRTKTEGVLQDINGDGMADFSRATCWDNGTCDLAVYHSTGSGFELAGYDLPHQVFYNDHGEWSVKTEGVLQDINGDGIADFSRASHWEGGAQDTRVYHGTGSGFVDAGYDLPRYMFYVDDDGWGYKVEGVLQDINGDGLADYVSGTSWDVSSHDWRVYHGTGSGFEDAGYNLPEKLFWNDPAGWSYRREGILRDLNGDGKADYSTASCWDSGRCTLDVYLGTGSGFVDSGYDLPNKMYYLRDDGHSNHGYKVEALMEDFNGDGRVDFSTATCWDTGGCDINVYHHTTAGFVDAGYDLPDRVYDNQDGSFTYKTQAVVKDFNGDGSVDFVNGYCWDTGGCELDVHANDDTQSLITEFSSGHGTSVVVEYDHLTNPEIYTKDSGTLYPGQDLQTAMTVVSAYETDNGIGSTTRNTYHYTGLKADLEGRGSCGFAEVQFSNEVTGSYTISYNHQAHPFKGMPYKSETYLEDGTLISKVENTWAINEFADGTYHTFIELAVVSTYETDGSLVKTQSTSYEYDDHGNATTVEVSFDDGYSQVTTNLYENDTTNWVLARLTQSQVTATAPGQPAITRTSTFGYASGTGLLIRETTEPGTDLELQKDYAHDSYGNIVLSTTSGSSITSRSQTTAYDEKGRFALTSTNPLGYTTDKEYHSGFGALTSKTDVNGLTTTFSYDDFGRIIGTTNPDGTQSATTRVFCSAAFDCPMDAVYLVRQDVSGGSYQIEYFDKLDRVVRIETLGFSGQSIFVDTNYNQRGQKSQTSQPYFAGDSPQWSVMGYDDLGRLTQVTLADGNVMTTSYNGLSTTTTNELGHAQTKTVNSQGKLVSTMDAAGHVTEFVYDSFLNPVSITDSAGHQTLMAYDNLGRRVSLNDPDTGASTSVYNTLGELTSQTDAAGHVVTLTYDVTGRLIQKHQEEGTITWEYDTQDNGVGKTSRVISYDGYEQKMYYDAYSRPFYKTTTMNDQTFAEATVYDAYGRAKMVVYPSGFATANVYNEFGHLSQVKNAKLSDGTVYWQASAVNAHGQWEQYVLGNGVTTQKTYNMLTGRLETIASSAALSLQNLSYTYDAAGNLSSRLDNDQALSESFVYDNLNRLTSATVVGQPAQTVSYDALGNITYKSDVGDYTYGEGAAGPHAVTSVSGSVNQNYTYDVNGNRVSSSQGTVSYTSFNKPAIITDDGGTVIFAYGPTGSRYYKQVVTDSTASNTVYLKNYERVETSDQILYHHYILGGDGIAAIHTEKSDAGIETKYLLKDHLGSVDVVVDADGNALERLSYDAWGKRRNSDWTTAVAGSIDSAVNLGFTAHETLDDVELIHMNGRVYDPVIGRFLSPDPFVQAPENSQSLNRYSYVINNPLTHVDANGYFFDDLWDFVKTAVTVVATVYTGGLASGFVAGLNVAGGGIVSAALSGAASHFASNATATLLNGGSLDDAFNAGLDGIGTAALTAGAFQMVGDGFGHASQFGTAQHGAKILAHGAVGGLSRMAQGGKFEHGFLSGAVTQALAPAVSGINQQKLGFDAGRTFAAAAVGGTASALGGGKFVNGAMTGAFSRMYNDDSVFQKVKARAKKAWDVWEKTDVFVQASAQAGAVEFSTDMLDFISKQDLTLNSSLVVNDSVSSIGLSFGFALPDASSNSFGFFGFGVGDDLRSYSFGVSISNGHMGGIIEYTISQPIKSWSVPNPMMMYSRAWGSIHSGSF